jgi:ubiquinone/menaquinone biosynthesis C-methylase UbiE
MGVYEGQVLPRLIDKMLDTREHRAVREAVTSTLDGVVLEVGFGSGLNVPHYPPHLERVYAVDPAVVGRRLAEPRLADCPVPVDFVGLEGESIPLDDASVDAVLTTFTLCTIPDVERALVEMRRILRPGGTFHFVEHGRHPDPSVAKWQDRFNPVQKFFAGGCHINRQIDELVTDAGFELQEIDNPTITGPSIETYLFRGVALNPH